MLAYVREIDGENHTHTHTYTHTHALHRYLFILFCIFFLLSSPTTDDKLTPRTPLILFGVCMCTHTPHPGPVDHGTYMVNRRLYVYIYVHFIGSGRRCDSACLSATICPSVRAATISRRTGIVFQLNGAPARPAAFIYIYIYEYTCPLRGCKPAEKPPVVGPTRVVNCGRGGKK